MNVERILQLADVIEKTPHRLRYSETMKWRRLSGFNMSNWHCGTTGCIAGWACDVFGNGNEPFYTDEIQFDAAVLLGLPHHIADDLFVPTDGALTDIKPKHAANVLRHLAETGEVDWSIADARATGEGK